MRWEDCVKRDLERVKSEWRTTAKYRSRTLLIQNAVREKVERKMKESKKERMKKR